MSNRNGGSNRARLQQIAHRAMIERGLGPDFPPKALADLDRIREAPVSAAQPNRDLRSLLWCSIDNDDSRDLDQLTVAEALPDGAVRALVAVADVDSLVPLGSAIDGHARQNTTSVYTAGGTFPMLPEKLSTDLTSLGEGVDRPAIVVSMTFGRDGSLQSSEVVGAMVRNRAKLAYPSVADWLDGKGPEPARIGAVSGLADNLRLQDRLAQLLRSRRHKRGALDFETIHAHPVFEGDVLKDLEPEERNRARNIIEELMVAGNNAIARFLDSRRFPSIRRVVRTPKHWDGIVELALARGAALPPEPDGKALALFLAEARAKDPVRFPDLSLGVIKLIGSGEYVLETPGQSPIGHFGLAVKDYAHSTAPNRRYPDLITQRLLKAAVSGKPSPYSPGELASLATHCTAQEGEAKKVERQVAKSAAAILLESRIGATFDAIATGVTETGTWVRIARPPVEGMLVDRSGRLKVGDRLRVALVHVDVERGHIDFKPIV
jgi:exoribonuclease-2